jgi:hypothetical protein
MQPISRETVMVDRRQPVLRWSAVFAASICSIGFWILLQLIGVGIGLSSVDVDDITSLRGAGIGSTAWSLISPLIAMFLGGYVAGKLAHTYDRKLAGAHGLVMWALTSIAGLFATIWIVSMVASGAARHRAFDGPGSPAWDGVRRSAAIDRRIDSQLGTSDTRPRTVDRLTTEREALEATDATGKALTGAGVSLLLALATSILGAMLALHRRGDKGEHGRRHVRHATEPGFSPAEPVAPAAPYPTPSTPMTGPATPVIPPHDLGKP